MAEGRAGVCFGILPEYECVAKAFEKGKILIFAS
jgi:hypothetical protein